MSRRLLPIVGGYDVVAPFYDSLAQVIYGDAIVNSQAYLIKNIPANSTILVAGGGTGKILELITAIHSAGLQIVYVELSKKMIDLSKRRPVGKNNVVFIHESIGTAVLVQKFDVVITPFLFDNFSEDTAKLVFMKLDVSLKPAGLWLFADFKADKDVLWQNVVLKLMYWSFRLLCKIEASALPDTDSLFSSNNYKLLEQKSFFRNFIYSVIYRKC